AAVVPGGLRYERQWNWTPAHHTVAAPGERSGLVTGRHADPLRLGSDRPRQPLNAPSGRQRSPAADALPGPDEDGSRRPLAPRPIDRLRNGRRCREPPRLRPPRRLRDDRQRNRHPAGNTHAERRGHRRLGAAAMNGGTVIRRTMLFGAAALVVAGLAAGLS